MADGKEIPCGSMMNAGSPGAPDVQFCIHSWPHPGVPHTTADGETWDEQDPRVVGF